MRNDQNAGREPEWATATRLLNLYEAFLIDAYGVLVNSQGSLPHAREFIDRLNQDGRPYLILTNDASRLPEQAHDFYGKCGLSIPLDRILTSGSLIKEYFQSKNLQGSRCFVLGTPDSIEYVRRAGGEIIEISDDVIPDAIVICDDSGFALGHGLNAIITVLVKCAARGAFPRLILPNPDLIYPKGSGRFGFTSGGLASMFEAVLAQLCPKDPPRFTRLGKPFPPIFKEALARIGPTKVVVIGDQVATDIQGAVSAKLDSALISTGIHGSAHSFTGPADSPTWLMKDLSLF